MKVCTRNAIRCKQCGDVIESRHGHDFKSCSCKSVSVDGGVGAGRTIRRLWPSGEAADWFDDLSEFREG